MPGYDARFLTALGPAPKIDSVFRTQSNVSAARQRLSRIAST
jgi:hypothetical protein